MGLAEVLPSVGLLLEAFMQSELAKNMRTALPIPVCMCSRVRLAIPSEVCAGALATQDHYISEFNITVQLVLQKYWVETLVTLSCGYVILSFGFLKSNTQLIILL